MIKLHLGCGNKHLKDYINIDFYKTDATDLEFDIYDIDERYSENSVDVIYMSHVLEHFERNKANILLHKLYKVLKVGGILRIAVPDWDAVCYRYKETGDLRELLHILYGNHDKPLGGHYNIWSFHTISEDLKEIGFKEVRKYDWKKTDHSYMDDFSRAHLPHDPEAIKTGNFNNHMLMSLNVEAIK